MDDEVKQRIASRFCVIASFGETMHPNADHLTIKTTTSKSMTRAEVSSIGSWLRVNPSTFPSGEVETRIITFIHEAGHLGNQYHHKPAFWEIVADIANAILSSEQAQRTIQSQFSTNIDWYKVRYRLVQDVSANCVDKRCETVEERQRKLAKSLQGYDVSTAQEFDMKRYSWWVGDPENHLSDPYSVSVTPSEFDATADGITDTQFREFIDTYGRPQDDTHTSFIAPLTYTTGSIRRFVDTSYAHQMMQFCDRRGMEYCPMTDVSAVVDGVAKLREDTDDVHTICERFA